MALQIFNITLEFFWANAGYPINYPVDAHTGNQIVVLHNRNYNLFRIGGCHITGNL